MARKQKFHYIHRNQNQQRMVLKGDKLVKHNNRWVTFEAMEAENKSFLEH